MKSFVLIYCCHLPAPRFPRRPEQLVLGAPQCGHWSVKLIFTRVVLLCTEEWWESQALGAGGWNLCYIVISLEGSIVCPGAKQTPSWLTLIWSFNTFSTRTELLLLSNLKILVHPSLDVIEMLTRECIRICLLVRRWQERERVENRFPALSPHSPLLDMWEQFPEPYTAVVPSAIETCWSSVSPVE